MGMPGKLMRAARPSDIDAIMQLAAAVGKGMTNLPADRPALLEKLQRSEARLANNDPHIDPTPIWLVLESDGEVAGTSALFPSIGSEWPFYSYRRTQLSNRSLALNKTVSLETLTLNNDLTGMAEVGGLVVMPQARGSGAGRLAAQSRYLFIAEHRTWFPAKVMAELRGFIDADGRSPVWESLGRPFYQMSFEDADHISGVSGNQFIAELSPKQCLYVGMLPVDARSALGRPHDESRLAYNMLLLEGFRDLGYCDIFDGGPQVFTDIEDLRLLKVSQRSLIDSLGEDPASSSHICSSGHDLDFRAIRCPVSTSGCGIKLPAWAAEALHVKIGDYIRHGP